MHDSCFGPSELWNYFVAPWQSNIACYQALAASPTLAAPNETLYPKLFFLTCALEAPVYALVMRSKTDWRCLQILAFVVALNIATHPLVSFGFPSLVLQLEGTAAQSVLVSEAFAPLLEAVLLAFFAKIDWRTAFFTAVAANLLSWWGGGALLDALASR